MFDEIEIDLWFSWNFASMKNIIRICNLMGRFSKFTFNMEIYEKFVEFFSKPKFFSKLVWKKTLFTQKTLLSPIFLSTMFAPQPNETFFLVWWEYIFGRDVVVKVSMAHAWHGLEKNFVHPKNPTLSYFFYLPCLHPNQTKRFSWYDENIFLMGRSCKGLYSSCLAWRPWTFKAKLSGPWERSQDLCLSHRLLISLSLSLSIYIYLFIYRQSSKKVKLEY